MHIASFSAHDNLMKSPGYGKVGCAIAGGNILRQRHSFFSYHVDACWELRQGEMGTVWSINHMEMVAYLNSI